LQILPYDLIIKQKTVTENEQKKSSSSFFSFLSRQKMHIYIGEKRETLKKTKQKTEEKPT
jgi:hypothetical protein